MFSRTNFLKQKWSREPEKVGTLGQALYSVRMEKIYIMVIAPIKESTTMPWSEGHYPVSMKNLAAVVRKKAIEIANALLVEVTR